MYTVDPLLIRQLVVDFPFILILIKLFFAGCCGEAILANIDWKSAFLKEVGQFRSHFHVVGDFPREPFFARIDRLMNALQLYR